MSSIAIIGGLGHVGLPLGLFLAERGHNVLLQDRVGEAMARKLMDLNAGRMPFIETGADHLVQKHWGKAVKLTERSAQSADIIIVCIGTPLDEYQTPRLDLILSLAKSELANLRPEQLVILRSTVYPGTTKRVADEIGHPVAFCPERILQGFALKELATLPQIVSGTTPETALRARGFFEGLGVATVTIEPIEAELAKLFTNTWRLAQFGVANEFYKIGTELGADYARIHHAMTWNYPRCTIPVPGFAAGPCLRKDALCLAAAAPDGFQLGRQAVLSNELLVDWLVRRLDDPAGKVVAILGAAFKAENDDTRDSLSFRLKKLLEFRGARVVMTDPYVPGLLPLGEAMAMADLAIIATPHAEYRSIPSGPGVVRIWEAA
jgi:UDP-N-acetyl-D-mannosaminuronic acid dehydrogenase